MSVKNRVKELFCFHPQVYGYKPETIDDVCVIGEFNEWGRNKASLEESRLNRDCLGRWTGLVEVPSGMGLYKFLLNGNTTYPRSGHLGYSTVKTCDWAKTAVWYQIFPDRFARSSSRKSQGLLGWDADPNYFDSFGGDLKGIASKLDYFKTLYGSLDNMALYLNPLHLSAASNHKYWPEDFDLIDPQFGTEEDLKSLIDSFHAEGAKIVLDLVYNHTGLNHYAFLDVLKNGENSKYRNWYRELPYKLEIPLLDEYNGDLPLNVALENDPRSEDYDSAKDSFICVWNGKYRFPINDPASFSNSSGYEIIENQPYYKLVHRWSRPNYPCWVGLYELPELNTSDAQVKRHLFDVSRKWVRMGIDGFRLDVPDMLWNAHEFWHEFRNEINEEVVSNGKSPQDIYVVGELWSNLGVTDSYLGGDTQGNCMRFDAVMNYPLREAVFNFLSGEILNPACDQILKPGYTDAMELDREVYRNLCYVSWGVSTCQYNVFSSHDTRRLKEAIPDLRHRKAALAVQYTMPGSPSIYYGEELDMSGGADPENRRTFPWDVAENLKKHSESAQMFEFYRQLLGLRREYRCLYDSPVTVLCVDNSSKCYSYGRFNTPQDSLICILVRDAATSIQINLPESISANTAKWQNYFTGKPYTLHNGVLAVTPQDFADMAAIVLVPVKG